MRRVLLALCACLILAPAAAASTATTVPRLTKSQAISAFLHDGKVAHWIKHYPRAAVTEDAAFSPSLGLWRVDVSSGRAGVVADRPGLRRHGACHRGVDGRRRCYWTMAPRLQGRLRRDAGSTRGPSGSASASSSSLGLADLRRPLSLRNLDLLVAAVVHRVALVSSTGATSSRACRSCTRRCSTCSAAARGSAGAAARRPTSARCGPCGCSSRRPSCSWAARIGLNVADSNVIDVGVRERDRRRAYLRRPARRTGTSRSRRRRAATSTPTATSAGRSSRTAAASSRSLGDTYGPVAYETYLPAYALFGWSGHYLVPGANGTGATCRPRTSRLDRCSTCLPRAARAARLAHGRAPAGGDARVRLGRVPVHAVRVELELERRDSCPRSCSPD